MAGARVRVVVVLAALGLVAAAWLAGDGGAARAALGQATGPLVATVPGDAAVLVAQGLAPGDSRAGEVTVTNVGDAAGAFALSASDLVDANAPLSGVLDLLVADVTPGRAAVPVYTGTLADLSPVALGTLEQGEARRYRFTVSFPSGRPDDVDNAYQGASTSVTFVWSATATSSAGSAQGDATATRPPSIAVATTTARPVLKATMTTRSHQRGTRGVVATVACQAACRIAVTGTASAGKVKLRLRTVRRTLRKPGQVRVRLILPRAARAVLAAGRPVTVRLRMRATLGQRVLVTRRTVHLSRHRR